MIIKLAGKTHIPWKEQLDLLEVDALTDEYAWDDLLEAVEDGSGGTTSAHRVSTPIPNFHRHDAAPVKVATAKNWDSEFSSAQAHARELMARLGNAG